MAEFDRDYINASDRKIAMWASEDGEYALECIERLSAVITTLRDQINALEEELEMRDRRDMALQKNLEQAAEALRRAANVEKKPKGRLPR